MPFVRHALELGAELVAMLLRVSFLASLEHRRLFANEDPGSITFAGVKQRATWLVGAELGIAMKGEASVDDGDDGDGDGASDGQGDRGVAPSEAN